MTTLWCKHWALRLVYVAALLGVQFGESENQCLMRDKLAQYNPPVPTTCPDAAGGSDILPARTTCTMRCEADFKAVGVFYCWDSELVGSPQCLEQTAETDLQTRLIGEIDVYLERKRTAGMGRDFARVAKRALAQVLVLQPREITRFRISLKTPSEFITDKKETNSVYTELANIEWMNTSIVGVHYEITPAWNPMVEDERVWIDQTTTDLEFSSESLRNKFVERMDSSGWDVRGVHVPAGQKPFRFNDARLASQSGSLEPYVETAPCLFCSFEEGYVFCSDSDYGAKDQNGNSCHVYRSPELQPLCGRWDDEDFIAASMCCRCGGGGLTGLIITVIVIIIAIVSAGAGIWWQRNKALFLSRSVQYRKQQKLSDALQSKVPPQMVWYQGDNARTCNPTTMRASESITSDQLAELATGTMFEVIDVPQGRRIRIRVNAIGKPEDRMEGWISTRTETGEALVQKLSAEEVAAARPVEEPPVPEAQPGPNLC